MKAVDEGSGWVGGVVGGFTGSGLGEGGASVVESVACCMLLDMPMQEAEQLLP